jgi:Sec-independent protein translocase protein TatA
MTGEEWSRAMRAIWLLNTIEVDLSHLGIPLMRVPTSMRDLGDALKSMSKEDRRLIEDELSNAHAVLAQAVGELQAGMSEIETILRQRPEETESKAAQESTESRRSVAWQK